MTDQTPSRVRSDEGSSGRAQDAAALAMPLILDAEALSGIDGLAGDIHPASATDSEVDGDLFGPSAPARPFAFADDPWLLEDLSERKTLDIQAQATSSSGGGHGYNDDLSLTPFADPSPLNSADPTSVLGDVESEEIAQSFFDGSSDNSFVVQISPAEPSPWDQILEGTDGQDVIVGGDGNDLILGSPGADSLDGGEGIDTVSYAGSPSGVYVYLYDYYERGYWGDAAGDTYSNIENVIGSDYRDYLLGSSQDNVLWGGAGNDSINGWYGNDTLYGGAGNDFIYGMYGNDILVGEEGNDFLYDLWGADTFVIRVDQDGPSNEYDRIYRLGTDDTLRFENVIDTDSDGDADMDDLLAQTSVTDYGWSAMITFDSGHDVLLYGLGYNNFQNVQEMADAGFNITVDQS